MSLNINTKCLHCRKGFLPTKTQDNGAVVEDKRPVASRVCNHTSYCVDCFKQKTSLRNSKAWFECGICHKEHAFHISKFWVNDIMCVLLTTNWDGTIPETLRRVEAVSGEDVTKDQKPLRWLFNQGRKKQEAAMLRGPPKTTTGVVAADGVFERSNQQEAGSALPARGSRMVDAEPKVSAEEGSRKDKESKIMVDVQPAAAASMPMPTGDEARETYPARQHVAQPQPEMVASASKSPRGHRETVDQLEEREPGTGTREKPPVLKKTPQGQALVHRGPPDDGRTASTNRRMPAGENENVQRTPNKRQRKPPSRFREEDDPHSMKESLFTARQWQETFVETSCSPDKTNSTTAAATLQKPPPGGEDVQRTPSTRQRKRPSRFRKEDENDHPVKESLFTARQWQETFVESCTPDNSNAQQAPPCLEVAATARDDPPQPNDDHASQQQKPRERRIPVRFRDDNIRLTGTVVKQSLEDNVDTKQKEPRKAMTLVPNSSSSVPKNPNPPLKKKKTTTKHQRRHSANQQTFSRNNNSKKNGRADAGSIYYTWEDRVAQLTQYKEAFGHIAVPTVRKDPYYNLGLWLAAQRSLYRKKQLKKERLVDLQKLGCAGFEIGGPGAHDS